MQLGFDPDHKIVIDETYGSATKAAETAWEDSLGLTGDGKITKGELVFIPGRLLIDTVSATVGGSVNAGSALVVGRQAERKYLVAGLAGATIDHQAPVGTKVATGTVLYWSNGFPVMAIEGDATATPALGRDLSDGVTDGVDVKLFEQALDALGFDADSTMVVDDHFDAATATAATAWVASLGITADPATLVVPAGSFTVVPAGLSIGTPLITDGTVLEGDGVVLSLTAPSRQVTTTAPIGDDTFKLGAKIDVEFPDRTVQPVSPVVALDGALPAWRSLSTSSVDGADVAQLETSLVALGYDPALKVTVDNHFDSASRTMVKAWQKGLGVEQTGKVALGWVVFLPSGTTVSAVSQAVGNTIGDGDTVMTLAAPTQEVLVDVPAGDEAKVVPGLAVEIGDVQGAVVRLRSADRDGTVTVEAVIAPAPPIANATNGSAVKVTLTLQDDSGVLLAPAEALVSQLDGSYAVQVQTSDGTTKWLTVELLGVSGGNVALKGADLTDGTVVLLPA